ncbi:MAG TPA: hypothetical protein VH989_13040 [Actinomycetota bacterium]
MTRIRRAIEWIRGLPRWAQGLLAFIAYLLVSIVLFGLPVLANMSEVWAGVGTNDAKVFAWDLAWWPHAISNHLNPIFTTELFAPTGRNLMWITSMPGPSVLVWPITTIFGPVVSSNVLTLVGAPLAAWGGYLVGRRLSPRFWPAFACGLIFGFSTYETVATRGHLNLSLVVAVPLAVYLVLRRADGSLSFVWFVVLLALDLAFEFLTSTEVFASMSVFAVLVMLVALLVLHGRRRKVLLLGAQIAGAYALAAALLTPFLVYAFRDVPGAPLKDTVAASSDLLGFVMPRSTILFGHDLFTSTTSRFTARFAEDGTYVGIPLLVVVLAFAVTRRRDRVAHVLVPSFLLIEVAALGPTLHVGGETSITMPWAVAQHAPLLESALPVRFTLYAWLALAAIVARWLGSGVGLPWLAWGLVGLGTVFLIPNVTSEWHPDVYLPEFFAEGTYRDYLEPGEIVVLLPVDEGMYWQAETDLYFSLATAKRLGAIPPGYAYWEVAKRLRAGTIGERQIPDLRAFLAAHRVGAIVVDESQAGVWQPQLAPLGITPRWVGDVLLYDVQAA